MSDIVIYHPDDDEPTPEQERMLAILVRLAEQDVDEVYRTTCNLIPHTRGGRDTRELDMQYGMTHDYDCPACVASGSSFTASPRSETYWSS